MQRVESSGLARLPLFLALLIALASCVPKARPPAPPPAEPEQPPPPPNAVAAGISAGPADFRIEADDAERAHQAFFISCPALVRRPDPSGLTRPEDWKPICDQLAAAGAGFDRADWFRRNFELVQVGDGKAFATGYFEPQIKGSRVKAPGYEVPVYRVPPDLVELSAEAAAAAGTPRRGRMQDGVMVPYYERSEIEDGALAGKGLEIAWAADPIEFFFLQIQGSGRLALPDGSVMRIGYAGQNGREYVGIGRLMRERGLLEPGKTSMQGIVEWLRAHPEEGRAIMRENKSYIFFRELTGPGPLGALELPVTPRTTVAADPNFVPLGAPVLLDLDRPEASGLWIAQDTGGAIKGANRFDTFWGAGDQAALTAGGMQGRGKAWILLPKGTLARLRSNASAKP